MQGSAATPPPSRLLTRANALTFLRLVSAPLLAVAVVRGASGSALGLFALAVVTDLVDGRVARRYGEASPLGGLLDHSTDATFVSVGLAAVSVGGEVPVVLPLLIVMAFLQYMLDSRAVRGLPLRASSLGRWNGIAYFVLLGVPVVRDGLGLGWPAPGLVGVLAWLLVAATLLSITDRALARRRALPR